jgi:hypothetical protein
MASRARAKSFRRNGSPVLRVFVLIAFCLQSFVIQTHVHNLPQSTAATSQQAYVSAPHDGKAPLDADKCMFCQEYTHSGAYVMPALAAALPPMTAVGVIALAATPFLAAKPTSHIWIGRAPPRA